MFAILASQRGRAVSWLGATLLLCWLAAVSDTAQAAQPSLSRAQVWQAVGDRTLDTMRGGFNLGGGLVVSFGITRTVFINGDMVTQTTLNLGRLTDITPEWAMRLRQELQSIRLVQNGPGNTFSTGPTPLARDPRPGPSDAAAPGQVGTAVGKLIADAPSTRAIEGAATGTVIQNTLNNQQILHQTIINASSNGLGMLRLSSLHSTLSEAIRQSVGQR